MLIRLTRGKCQSAVCFLSMNSDPGGGGVGSQQLIIKFRKPLHQMAQIIALPRSLTAFFYSFCMCIGASHFALYAIETIVVRVSVKSAFACIVALSEFKILHVNSIGVTL